MEDLGENIYKINVDSNVYFLDLKEKIIIDTGPKAYVAKVIEELESVTELEMIDKVILTHIHFDHAGCVEIFPNAQFYASKKEIQDFKDNPYVAFNLTDDTIKFLGERLIDIESIKDDLKKLELEIIDVPGHTKGSVALFYEKDQILFSGDCKFQNGVGRQDLPNSVPEEMKKSLKKLEDLKYKILAPGHDY